VIQGNTMASQPIKNMVNQLSDLKTQAISLSKWNWRLAAGTAALSLLVLVAGIFLMVVFGENWATMASIGGLFFALEMFLVRTLRKLAAEHQQLMLLLLTDLHDPKSVSLYMDKLIKG
jgi:hypothetical protein